MRIAQALEKLKLIKTIKPVHWLAILLVLKALFMGVYITPLGDTPDESGHFAYIQNIADGDLLPKLGEANIRNDVWHEQTTVTNDRINYIVQHPPLYYWVAAVPYQIGSWLTSDREILNRLPRSISAFSLGALVLLLFSIFRQLGTDENQSGLMAVSVAYIPQIVYLSSGMTNDIFLFALCAAASLYFIKFLKFEHIRHAYWCGFWLAMAGLTKMTAWILIFCLFAAMLFEMRGVFRIWMKQSAILFLIAFSTPILWILRNIILFEDPLKISLRPSLNPVVGYTFNQFIFNQPIIDWLANHFYALIGFSGYCQNHTLLHLCSGIRLTRVGGDSIFIFNSILLLGLLVLVVDGLLSLRVKSSRYSAPKSPSIQGWVAFHAEQTQVLSLAKVILASSGFVIWWWFGLQFLSNPSMGAAMPIVVATSVPFILLLMAPWLLASSEVEPRIMAYAWLTFALAAVLVVRQSYLSYIMYGQLNGLQGRYFYPFLPLLMASFMLAFNRLKLPSILLLAAVLALAWAELSAYITQVLPFVLKVRV